MTDRGYSPSGTIEATTLWVPGAAPASKERDRAVQDPTLGDTLNQLAEGFSEQVAILDEDWTIVATNRAWRHMIRLAGYPELTPGINYRDFLETFVAAGHQNALAVLDGVKAIDSGNATQFELTYDGIDEWKGRTLQLRINRLFLEGRSLATITRQDITDRAELRRLRLEFNSSVLECQAAERRRFGRELHDSAAQLLTSAGLLLYTLKKKSLTRGSLAKALDEVQELLGEARQEIRSISYLGHPPALEDLSLADAIKALVEGFARRTGLQVSFERKGKQIRLSKVSESALYRIAQEGLANVHRHARAEHVRVSLHFRKASAHLVLIDDGIGISTETLAGRSNAGVGLAGMGSRLAEIGGRLSVKRSTPGTAICASVSARQAS